MCCGLAGCVAGARSLRRAGLRVYRSKHKLIEISKLRDKDRLRLYNRDKPAHCLDVPTRLAAAPEHRRTPEGPLGAPLWGPLRPPEYLLISPSLRPEAKQKKLQIKNKYTIKQNALGVHRGWLSVPHGARWLLEDPKVLEGNQSPSFQFMILFH